MKKPKPAPGAIHWTDLTVPHAKEIAQFYQAVAGWIPSAFDMGGYYDYCMKTPADGKTVAGICHKRGNNSGLPGQWLIYITVADLEASVRQCKKLGGSVIVDPKEMGEQGRYAVIRDPAGAVAALFQPA